MVAMVTDKFSPKKDFRKNININIKHLFSRELESIQG